jgi:hypothetical protein
MSAQKEVYLLDAGNTLLKLALVQDGVFQKVERFSRKTFHFPTYSVTSPLPFRLSLMSLCATYFALILTALLKLHP